MAGLSGVDAVREALETIEAAVETASRRRAWLIRELATAPDADRDLVEALIRREAADAQTGASMEQRALAVLAEAHRVHDARARLTDEALARVVDEIDATWHWALEQADAAAAGLVGRTSTAIADAVAAYVAAYRGVVQAAETLDADAVTRAVAVAEDAARRLEDAL